MHLYMTSNRPGLCVSVTGKCTLKTRAGRTFIFIPDGTKRDMNIQLADDA